MKPDSDKIFLISSLLVAMAVGAVYLYPDVRFIMEAGARYKSIAPIGFTDETLYLGRINALYRGDLAMRNPAIYEHRNDPVIMPSLSEFIEGGAGRILRFNLAKLDMLATFLLPFLIFILTALFAYSISGMPYGSILSSLAVLFGMHLFSRVFLLTGRIVNNLYTLPLWFTRPITPQTHFVFFLLALIFIYKAFIEERAVYPVLGGVFLGALFYVSVFYWAYIYALIGVLSFMLFLNKRYLSLRNMVLVAGIAAAVSAPYWLENIRTLSHSNYPLLLYRFNIAYSHRPILPMPATGLLLFAIVIRGIIISTLGKKAFYFIFSMLTAIILTLNQQILTGRLFKESHWTTYTGKFAVIVIGVLLTGILFKHISGKTKGFIPVARIACVSFFTILFLHAVCMQTNYHLKHFDYNLKMQDMAPLFDWFRSTAPPDSVILPSPHDIRLSELIPIYTNNCVYYSEPFFCLSLISFDETRFRMLACYRIFDFSMEDAVRHTYSWDGAIFLTNDSNRDRPFMDKERADLVSEYGMMLAGDGLGLVRRYKADYVVAVNGRDDGVIAGLVASGLRKVYDDGTFSVIKV